MPITSAIALHDQAKGAGEITQEQFEQLVNGELSGAPDYVHFALMAVMALIPIALVVSSFVIYMKKYKIDEKEYDRICEEIRVRDEAAENGECTCDCGCECDCADGECTCDCDENCDETCTCSCHSEAPAEEVFEEVAADEAPAEEAPATDAE